MKTLIKKLENRQNMTPKALTELFELIAELEENLSEDITTIETQSQVKIKAEDYNVGDYTWLLADDSFSLFIEDGKIKIKNIFTKEKKDKYYDEYYENLSYTFNYFNTEKEDRNIVRVNFSELTKALGELMKLVVDEVERIDSDAQEFINFCKEWKNLKEKELEKL